MINKLLKVYKSSGYVSYIVSAYVCVCTLSLSMCIL